MIALVQQAQNAELRRRLGMDSTNSSTPPSTDSIAAKVKRRKANSQRERSTDRKPGGQKGHPGSGLELAPEAEMGDTVPVEPAECSTCGEHLGTGSVCEGFTPVQQWDIPPVHVEKVQFNLMRRRCSAGHLTQAPAPAGCPASVTARTCGRSPRMSPTAGMSACAEGHRYIGPELLARSRMQLIAPDTDQTGTKEIMVSEDLTA
ncbi:DUF6444 domain-containing protein [Actinokineospora sp.]|uniref:DUF6444 domain-containing protein n=1 Tax=Actinokineospora sp. TaxID=1872133 RepID=UPI003D6AB766